MAAVVNLPLLLLLLLFLLLLTIVSHPADGAELVVRFDSGFRLDAGASNCSLFRSQLEVSAQPTLSHFQLASM